MTNPFPVKSTKRSFEILEILIETGSGRVTEIANSLDIPKSTVHDHLSTLRSIGVVSKDGDTYRTSPRILRFGEQTRAEMEIYEVAKPELQKLARRADEHASLMVEENGEGIYLYTAEGGDTVRKLAHDGTATKLHLTAPGKAILANRSTEFVETVVETHGLQGATPNSTTEIDQLTTELEQIRADGYAIDREEAIEGFQGVATPIVSEDGERVHGAISLYGPATRQIETFRERVLDELLRTTNIVQMELRHTN